MNDFDKWCGIKKHINKKEKTIGIKLRDVVFINMGKNIGFEQNGKGEKFLRPVIVSKIFSKNLFFGIPLTSKIKKGNFFETVEFTYKNKFYQNSAILVQTKTFDTKRILYKKGMIKKEDFERLQLKLKELLTPSKDGEPRRELVDEIVSQKKANVKSCFIHESSFVDKNVKIGENTKIWHFCHILSNTTIGNNCSFGQNCVIGPNVKIGNGVKVQNNISIYDGVKIEDDVFLGPSMVFTNVINPRAFIQRKNEFKKTLLKKGCTIGANATIICGVTIGEYALIGAGAVINKDVKPYALMVGVPARQIGWVGISGNRLEFDSYGNAEDQFGYYTLDKEYIQVQPKYEK